MLHLLTGLKSRMMTPMSNTEIMERAKALATENTLDVSFKKFFVLLENAFFGIFGILGWLVGRTWFYGAQTLFVVGLAFKEGYVKGAKAPVPVPEEDARPDAVPAPPLMNDGRTMNQYDTPFGVPFGPNVFASHD